MRKQRPTRSVESEEAVVVSNSGTRETGNDRRTASQEVTRPHRERKGACARRRASAQQDLEATVGELARYRIKGPCSGPLPVSAGAPGLQ